MGQLTIIGGANRVHMDITGKNLLTVLKENFPDGLGYDDIQLNIGGVDVDLREFNINRVFLEDITAHVNPKGITAIVVGIVVGLASTLLLTPEVPDVTTQTADSPNNSFFGQTNRIRLFDLEPSAYGSVVSYPDLITPEGGFWEYINNQKTIREAMLIGIQAYETGTPRYEQTPLDSISGQSYEIYEPNELVPTIYGQFNSDYVDGQTLQGPNNGDVTIGEVAEDPASIARSYTTTNTSFRVPKGTDNWDAIANIVTTEGVMHTRFTYEVWQDNDDPTPVCELNRYTTQAVIVDAESFGSLWIFHLVPSSEFEVGDCGDITGPYVKVEEYVGTSLTVTLPKVTDELQCSFDFRGGLKGSARIMIAIPSAFSMGVADYSIVNYSADTSEQVFRTFKKPVQNASSRSELVVKLIRMNNDKDDNTDRVQVSQVAVNSYRYNVNYGDRTILTTERVATQQAITLRDPKINLDITRKTITYDTVTGQVDYNLTASRSFADAILHEYVMVQGLSPDDLDLDELYSIYESLPSENLGHFDYTFADKEQSIKERMDVIANVARSFVTFTGEGYTFHRDEKKAPAAQFDSRNIAADSPEEVSYRGAVDTSNDGVKLEWINPATNKPDYVYYKIDSGQSVECVPQGGGVYIPELPSIPLEINLTGCSELDQAQNRCDMECRKLIFLQRTARIKTLVDGENVSIGQAVRYADYYQEDIAMGEIESINGDVFTSYSDIEVDDGDYHVTYTDNIGNVYGPVPVTILSAKTFQATMPEAYVSDGYFIQSGTRFIISTVEEHANNLYVVSNKESNQDGTVSLELSQYDERIYPEED